MLIAGWRLSGAGLTTVSGLMLRLRALGQGLSVQCVAQHLALQDIGP